TGGGWSGSALGGGSRAPPRVTAAPIARRAASSRPWETFGRARGVGRSSCRSWLDELDVGGVRALGALLGLVGHLRTLGEGAEAVGLDRAEVHEQILAAVIGRDEAVALVVVEPLDGSVGHVGFL